MAITTFDTLKFVRKLEEAGVPSEQAEVQAEVLTEAFNVNLESLVTKDHLAARFAEQNASIDTRFAEQNAYIDTRFEKQNAYIDTRFEKQNSDMNTRFAEQKTEMKTGFARLDAKIDGNFRIFLWTQAIVMAGVILPYLERLMAL
ncbi:MAG: hypothetical protein QGG02_06635 [Gammaproteobacteria bacterium]|nr:hypothetical protein [Gammaproteobacteria bacterium]MDP6731481.1 hypothetical protein [Gammaproteobacteria bacterium]